MEVDNGLAIVSQTEDPKAPPIATAASSDNSQLTRKDFPGGFVFGTGTSAYQVEGGAAVGGRGASIWDSFTLQTPNRILDGSNGNVACDMYHRYKEDIAMMKKMGFDAYRFSISWPRILPGGRASAGINREGIDFYNDLIDTVIANGMEPYVTLFHWDLPDLLEKELGGFLNRNIWRDFVEYAELCFWEFGDRVKMWATLNEPWTYAVHGYVRGTFPPSELAGPAEEIVRRLPAYRSTRDVNLINRATTTRSYIENRNRWDPAKDAYTVARNMLVAHAHAVDSYRTKFQENQKGLIGLVTCSHWFTPYDDTSEQDIAASRRAIDFMLGWFLDPMLYGRYPQNMIDYVPAENLAPFSPQEVELLTGSIDYFGLNFYTANYVQNDPEVPTQEGYFADQRCIFLTERNGIPIGPSAGSSSDWLFSCPWAIYEHLKYIKERYPTMPPIYITENGFTEPNLPDITAREACVDPMRVSYHQDHLANILRAMQDNQVDVRGYFAWSWCDNFEWAEGYTSRFGINYLDYVNNLTRYPKDSAVWFRQFLHGFPPKQPRGLSLNKRSIENTAESAAKKRRRTAEGGIYYPPLVLSAPEQTPTNK